MKKVIFCLLALVFVRNIFAQNLIPMNPLNVPTIYKSGYIAYYHNGQENISNAIWKL
jgi:hypothetical protein